MFSAIRSMLQPPAGDPDAFEPVHDTLVLQTDNRDQVVPEQPIICGKFADSTKDFTGAESVASNTENHTLDTINASANTNSTQTLHSLGSSASAEVWRTPLLPNSASQRSVNVPIAMPISVSSKSSVASASMRGAHSKAQAQAQRQGTENVKMEIHVDLEQVLGKDASCDQERVDASEDKAREDKLRVCAGKIEPLGVPAPATYADATNLATQYPEIASRILSLPVGHADEPVVADEPSEGIVSSSTSANSKSAANPKEKEKDLAAHTSSQPNWALAPKSPSPSEKTKERDGKTRRRKRGGRDRNKNAAAAQPFAQDDDANTSATSIRHELPAKPTTPLHELPSRPRPTVPSLTVYENTASASAPVSARVSRASTPLSALSTRSHPASALITGGVGMHREEQDVPYVPAPAPVRLQVIAVPVPVSSAAVPMSMNTSGQVPFAFHGHSQGQGQGFGQGQGQGQGRPVSAPTVAQVDALMQELQNARGMGSASVPVGSAFLPGTLGNFSAVAPGYHAQAQAQAQANGRLPPFLGMNMNMNSQLNMPLPSGLPPLSTQTFPVSFPFSHRPSVTTATTAFSTTPTSTHTPRPLRTHANSRAANIRAKAKWVRDRHGILRPDLHLDTDVRAELRLMAHSATSSPMSEESGAGGGRRFWVEESGSGSGSGIGSGSGSGMGGQGKGQGKGQSLLQQVEEGMAGERGSTMSAQSRVASPDMFDEDTFDALQDRVLDAPERPHSSASMTVPDHRYAPVPDDASPGTSGFQHPWPTLEEICALKAARNTT